ncbi:MAG: LytTR family DNA-binding domain-containing protein [Spirosomataceae bacterium]
MTLRCLAVDDEKLALRLLEDNIRQVPFLELVKSCKNAFEAMQVLQQEQIDLLFLDIQMPGLLGTKFLQSLTEKPMVIFITAYDQYAVESYDLNVIDYLLKPVTLERFVKAVNKAHEQHALRQAPAAPVATALSDAMFVNVEYSLVKIRFADILYIEALKDYVKIFVTTATKPILTKLNLKAIEEKLPTEQFLRVHRSFIVSLDKIESIRNHRIRLGNTEIPLSDAHADTLYKSIGAEE